jgi:ribonuclease D
MELIRTTEALAAFCERAAQRPYVTVDTEFLRERTYYSKLCLMQMAYADDADGEAVLIDTLEDGLSLAPVYELFRNTNVVKVFHAARQDIEIFVVDAGVVPEPLFDTQVAAMVCGYGEQVGYETLVRKIAKADLDKSSRFTDWSRRPLTDAQAQYALGDVTHLRQIYEVLAKRLEKTGRARWVAEEMGILKDPETYRVEPENAWKRVKTRTQSAKFLAIVKELAAFRESYAQRKNIPRNRVFKDDALVELASTKPRNEKDLGRSRLLLREARKGEIADGILKAITAGLEMPADQMPSPDKMSKPGVQVNVALADLLRVLLKAKSENADVAQKLIASATDLDAIASGERDLPALKGWRREVFGEEALQLCDGKIALAVQGRRVTTLSIGG